MPVSLHRLASEGDRILLEQALREGADAAAHEGFLELTPLHGAAETGHIDIIYTIMASPGVQVDAKDKHGNTPLLKTAIGGHLEAMEALIDGGADFKITDRYGRNALHLAAEQGHSEYCQRLLERGVDVEAADKYGKTPLLRAAVMGHGQVVGHLLAAGAHGDVQDSEGWTPLFKAVEGGHESVVLALLARGANVDTQDADGNPPLYWAVVGGNPMVVRALLAAGASADTKDSRGESPLHCACSSGKVEVCTTLLVAGAKATARNKGHSTPLHLAAFGGHVGCMDAVLLKGAKVDAHDAYYGTPLHKAAEGGHKEAALRLLNAGAGLNAKDTDGWTPLFWAVEGGHEEAVEALIKAGAEVGCKDLDDRTPLYRAAVGGHAGVVRILVAAGAGLADGDKYGRSPLHRAAEKKHVQAVEALMDAGADPDAVDLDGRSPLHAALSAGAPAAARALLEHGGGGSRAAAMARQQDRSGATPLHLAARLVPQGPLRDYMDFWRDHEDLGEVLKALAEAWPEAVSLEENGGRTPVDIARKRDVAAVVTFFTGWTYAHRRYEVFRDRPVHKSATSTVLGALDHMQGETWLPDGVPVVLKFMRHPFQLERERDLRGLLDRQFVLPILRAHDEPSKAPGPRGCPPLCVAMEAAGRTLGDVLRHEGLCGTDWARVREIAKELATAIGHMHEKGFVHCDVKPDNFVRAPGGPGQATRMLAIDLEGALRLGATPPQLMGARLSSAYLPPEMVAPSGAVRAFEPRGTDGRPAAGAPGASALLPASPICDLWAYGAIMYQMCVRGGAPLFAGDASDNLSEAKLAKLAAWGKGPTRAKKLACIEFDPARNFVAWLLDPDPAKRPSTMAEVLDHALLKGEADGDVVRAFEGTGPGEEDVGGSEEGKRAPQSFGSSREEITPGGDEGTPLSDEEEGEENPAASMKRRDGKKRQTSPRPQRVDRAGANSARGSREAMRRRPVTPSRLLRSDSGKEGDEGGGNSSACTVQ